jgi:CRP/FNR family transcriptional regulator
MTVTEFIRTQVPFLTGLTEDQALYLAKGIEQKPYRSGQTIVFKGVSVEGLHIVAQGRVSVHVKPDKKDWVKVAELGPGDVFGETSIMEFAMAGATIKSMKDDTLIFVIPQETFRKLLATDPELEKRTVALIEQRKQAQAKKPEETKSA